LIKLLLNHVVIGSTSDRSCHATGTLISDIYSRAVDREVRLESRFEHVNFLCISADCHRRRQANFLRDTVRTRGWLMVGLLSSASSSLSRARASADAAAVTPAGVQY
jgi:hypothetical protein